MKLSIITISLLAAVVSICGQPVNPAAPAPVTKDNVFKFYKDFTRLTKKPVFLQSEMTDLCRPLPAAMVQAAKQNLGPHYGQIVHYYANPLAAAALVKKQKVLPEGAIIVKEKLPQEWQDRETKEPHQPQVPSGIGGMIKRGAGFDPEHGDWEYFYADVTTPFVHGKLNSCADCHAKAKDDDHLFQVRDLPE